MNWKLFCHLFASTSDFWQTTAVRRRSEYLTLLDHVDGTTRADKMVSSAMIQNIKALVGEDVVVSSEEDIRDVSTGFVIDPIDGSWNYKYDYPACCRVVSYLENSQVKFFAIFNIADGHCVCSNGTDFFHNSQYYTLNDKDISPLVAVMYNTHYRKHIKQQWLECLTQLTLSDLNIRVSGSPSFDLYGLLTGQMGGIINLSPHAFDAQPIIACLANSSHVVLRKINNSQGGYGYFVGRPAVVKKWDLVMENNDEKNRHC